MMWAALFAAVVYAAYLIGVYVGWRLSRHDDDVPAVYDPPSHVRVRKDHVYDWETDVP